MEFVSIEMVVGALLAHFIWFLLIILFCATLCANKDLYYSRLFQFLMVKYLLLNLLASFIELTDGAVLAMIFICALSVIRIIGWRMVIYGEFNSLWLELKEA